ncbi:MAG TPA: DUF6596 domain-containing protein [Rudaea sp.]|jgi:RNA polymerase sigma-70 factor (ECF subfamily)|nr:DUF6596 domain-containing protein [Rudaea sp.]
MTIHASRARDTAEAIARRSYGKLVAFLAAPLRDVAAAEDALSEAFAAALTDWPVSGCPANPEAWLLTVARRKSIDASRRQRTNDLAIGELRILDDIIDSSGAREAEIPDQRLGLMFACAHPAIDASIRAPLMLQTVLGLDAASIASAFLVSSATMGKRLVRAKEKIRGAGISFAIPDRDELAGRLECVLDAIYAAYSEGWNDPVGTEAARRDLAEEAMFLGRIMVELAFDEPEALGLLALMLYTEARRDTRRTSDGDYVPLDEQDASRWDASMIATAEELTKRAGELRAPGRYQLEAALQSAHVHRRMTGQSNWSDIVALYDALLELSDSPVIAINRALAVAEVDGARAALAILPDSALEPRLIEYQPYWAARASLLARTGAIDDARRAYDIAVGLEHDPAVRKFLQRRKDMLSQ